MLRDNDDDTSEVDGKLEKRRIPLPSPLFTSAIPIAEKTDKITFICKQNNFIIEYLKGSKLQFKHRALELEIVEYYTTFKFSTINKVEISSIQS